MGTILTAVGKDNTLWVCQDHVRLIKFLQKEGFGFVTHKSKAGLVCEICGKFD